VTGRSLESLPCDCGKRSGGGHRAGLESRAVTGSDAGISRKEGQADTSDQGKGLCHEELEVGGEESTRGGGE